MQIKGKKILVIGDVILDLYVDGDCDRISQEAPVPILNAKGGAFGVLGGAGNVAANVVALGGRAALLTLLNPVDGSGQEIIGLCADVGIKLGYFDDGRQTTTKTRFISNGQQLLRVDEETTKPFETKDKSLAKLFKTIDQADLVVISDYGKGMFTNEFLRIIINYCVAAKKPTVVDPKPLNKLGYRGCNYITPNTKEIDQMVHGGYSPHTKANALADDFLCEVLLTEGEDGIFFAKPLQREGKSFPAQAKEVFDVSGAGDTVVAAFALALASGNSEEESILFANKAAGVVVGKRGTATVTQQEIEEYENS